MRENQFSLGSYTEFVTPGAFAVYLDAIRDPAAVHAMCEDYRAAASIDLQHDRASRAAGKRVRCPLLALWGKRGSMERSYDVLQMWRSTCGVRPSSAATSCPRKRRRRHSRRYGAFCWISRKSNGAPVLRPRRACTAGLHVRSGDVGDLGRSQ